MGYSSNTTYNFCQTSDSGSLYMFTVYCFQLEKGVGGLFDSFARLDSRISSVGQTAAKIGDHLQVIISYTVFFCYYYVDSINVTLLFVSCSLSNLMLIFISHFSECRISTGNCQSDD